MLTSKLGNVKLKSEKRQVNLAERTAMDKKDILKKHKRKVTMSVRKGIS
ncbi:hypothetical protein HMPREF1557_00504 [Streptococcus sobrinus W1703]|uniref:Uncharacterized protein n=1 Tax=Streptococcus sobrinus W1703 TaxID=1227275 RepID=U2KSV9_9STRE|nr:hypothetical protein HMPREF1557_00504 [Streptococcus sobrinus W1703]